MPPLRKITITVKSETTLAILHYLKEVKRLRSERAIELALKKYFDEL